ncbi:MAG: STAS domain-containing protein, partial [Spirochaetales bacterium]|nr:STAS domain-containing protein [Spirochaetales bacterium]
MTITREDRDRTAVYALAGEMDLYCSQEVKERIQEALDEGIRKIVLECSDLSYLDSSGIGVLISLLTSLRKQGGSLVLCSLCSTVRSVIQLTKLTGFLPVTDTLEDALEHLGTEEDNEPEPSVDLRGIIRDNNHPLLSTAGMYHKE